MSGGWRGTEGVMRFLATEISRHTYVNVMDQYRPCWKAEKDAAINRRITRGEYEQALEMAGKAGLQGWMTGARATGQVLATTEGRGILPSPHPRSTSSTTPLYPSREREPTRKVIVICPIFEFRCEECKKTFETLVFGNQAVPARSARSKKREELMSRLQPLQRRQVREFAGFGLRACSATSCGPS